MFEYLQDKRQEKPKMENDHAIFILDLKEQN